MLEVRRCDIINALEKALRGLPVGGSNSTWPANLSEVIALEILKLISNRCHLTPRMSGFKKALDPFVDLLKSA